MKLYFSHRLKAFSLILALHDPFFSINIVVAITFRKHVRTIILLLLSLLSVLRSPPLYYAKSVEQ